MCVKHHLLFFCFQSSSPPPLHRRRRARELDNRGRLVQASEGGHHGTFDPQLIDICIIINHQSSPRVPKEIFVTSFPSCVLPPSGKKPMQIEQNSTVIALCFLRTNDAQAPREEEDKNGKRRTDGRRDCLNLDIFPILPHRFIFVIILSLSASKGRPPFRTVLQRESYYCRMSQLIPFHYLLGRA